MPCGTFKDMPIDVNCQTGRPLSFLLTCFHVHRCDFLQNSEAALIYTLRGLPPVVRQYCSSLTHAVQIASGPQSRAERERLPGSLHMSRAQRRQRQEAQAVAKALRGLSTSACTMLLARHGETKWNAEHRCDAWVVLLLNAGQVACWWLRYGEVACCCGFNQLR